MRDNVIGSDPTMFKAGHPILMKFQAGIAFTANKIAKSNLLGTTRNTSGDEL